MLVKDIIKKNCKQKMTIKEIAIHHHVSDRTIHNKIKKLSYEWDSRNTNSVGLFILKKANMKLPQNINNYKFYCI